MAKKKYDIGKEAGLLLGGNSYINTMLSFANKESTKNNPVVSTYTNLVEKTGTSKKDIEAYNNPDKSTNNKSVKTEINKKDKSGTTNSDKKQSSRSSRFNDPEMKQAYLDRSQAALLHEQNIKEKNKIKNDAIELDTKLKNVKFGKVGIVSKGLQFGASIFGSLRRGH